MTQLTFIDMFAGIGGFRSGLEKAGHKCVGYIEWDKFARQSYQAIYDTKGEFTANDIQETKGIELPEADLWTFGSPCTNISLAGNRTGLKGEQSRMFFEVIRLLKERAENQKTLPAYLLMENVKSLLSSNGGRDFAKVIIEMDEVGYNVEWNVFDSAEVVPQHRERIYIVGHLRGKCTRKIFPIQGESKSSAKAKIKVIANDSKTNYLSHDIVNEHGISKTVDATSYKHVPQVAIHQGGGLEPSETTNQKPEIKIIGNVSKTCHHSDDVMSDNGISKTITAQNAYKHTPKVAVHQIGQLQKTDSFGGNPQVGRVYGTDGSAPTLNAMQGGGREPKVVIPVSSADVLNKNQNGRRFKNNGDPEFTLTARDRHGILTNNMKIRKLTPRECWRLQGFKDEQFDKAKSAGVSNSQLYKQAGNAVTVPVVRAIGEKLAETGMTPQELVDKGK